MEIAIIIAWLFSVLLFVLWVLVPFAIFGIKPLLRSILKELTAIRQEAVQARIRDSVK